MRFPNTKFLNFVSQQIRDFSNILFIVNEIPQLRNSSTTRNLKIWILQLRDSLTMRFLKIGFRNYNIPQRYDSLWSISCAQISIFKNTRTWLPKKSVCWWIFACTCLGVFLIRNNVRYDIVQYHGIIAKKKINRWFFKLVGHIVDEPGENPILPTIRNIKK